MPTIYSHNNPHLLSQLKTELVWGPYDEYGRRCCET